jgi:tetratricopeptide (TPR) repeat protein
LPLDREDTLKKAEKLLRQGRLDAAITEYLRVVEDQPKDWNTANTLGDLYMRAGQTPAAVAQFTRIAEHFMREGFYPKAGALYKKILKISPEEEAAQLSLAEISARQGLLADAKTYFNAVANRRRTRGDRRGADEIVLRLGDLDPGDLDARLAAARVQAHAGDVEAAANRYRRVYEDLLEKGRRPEALAALREAVRFDPADRDGRMVLAREALAVGDHAEARVYLDRDTAGDDQELLLAFVDVELQSGNVQAARDVLPKLLARDRQLRHRVMELAWSLTSTKPEAALACVDAIVEADAAASELVDAASVLEEYVARVPNQIAALLRLVEICVDGGLEATMFEAQAQLADAYLSSGQAGEARVIAEDLVAREPWDRAHIDRFRKSLILLNVTDPDAVIAERLNGQTPFMATDPFSDNLLPDNPLDEPEATARPSAEPAIPEPAPAPKPAVVEVQEQSADKPVRPPAPIEQPPPAERPTPSRHMKLGPMEIDLTSVLAEFSEAQPAAAIQPPPPAKDLDEVFQDFRDEVSRQAGADDAAQHMALATTYLEMGMEDDAIESLKQAARSPRYRFEAGTILTRLFKARKDLPQAVEWMERAAEAPAPSGDAGRALLYELGTTLEGMGETARALAVFMELQADAGEYRDVAARVDRLSRVQTGG